ncbi:MAG: VWA domain-containing protein [Phycisphaerales bacterium]
MRRQKMMSWIVAVGAVVMTLGAGVVPAAAQDEVQVLMPQRHVRPPWNHLGAQIDRVEAEIDIVGRVATTTLAITLSNPGQRQVQAELVIPVPDGSAIRTFSLDGLGDEPTARLLPRDEARRIYNDIVRRMIDPGLLEFAGTGLIRSSVFPVAPGGTQTFRVAYEQVLSGDGERVDYVLPRSESLEDSGVAWSVKARVGGDGSNGAPVAVFSPSHAIGVKPLGSSKFEVTATPGSMREPGSFRMSYILAQKGSLPVSVIAYPDPRVGGGKGGYFMLVAGSSAASAPTNPMPREVTVVIDRSGSMRGEKIEQAKAAALQIIEALDDGERFNIITYSDTIDRFFDKPAEKNSKTIEQARLAIGQIKAVGGTNIHDALLEALRPEPAPGTLPLVLFLTDGLPTIGVTGEKEIREAAEAANTHRRRVFTFGVGYDVNAPLLSALAQKSRAASTFVLPDEDVEAKVGQVFRKLAGPILVEPTLTAGPHPSRRGLYAMMIQDLMPGELPDLFAGEQLVVLGQYTTDEPFELMLTKGAEHEALLDSAVVLDPAEASTRNSFVPRLWAQRKIGSLIEQIRLSGDASATKGELVDEIVRLSLEYGILTEYTAFLAAEEGEFARAGGLAGDRFDAARDEAGETLRERAVEDRSGAGGVNQSLNSNTYAASKQAATRQKYYDKDMNEVEITTVQNVADRTLLRRQGRWVDARLLEKEAEAPEETIEFASEAYFALADRLAVENRQGLIAQRGDVYLLIDGKRVLVRNPS